jgi:hypothetical protein
MVDFFTYKIKPHFNADNLIVIYKSINLSALKTQVDLPGKILFWKGYGDGDLTNLRLVL